MSRIAIAAGLVMLGGVLAVGRSAPAPTKPDGPSMMPNEQDVVLQTIYQEFPKIDADPQVKLKDVLKSLETKFSRPEDKFFLTFEINTAALVADGVKDPAEFAIVKKKELP